MGDLPIGLSETPPATLPAGLSETPPGEDPIRLRDLILRQGIGQGALLLSPGGQAALTLAQYSQNVLLLEPELVVAQFGSFRLPLVILTPIPLTFIGIMFGHWLFHAAFTATSALRANSTSVALSFAPRLSTTLLAACRALSQWSA